VRRLALLGAAAAAYVFCAWLVPPGFYDGFAPAAPYHWVSPPPDLRSGNQQPSSGRATIAVVNGVSQAGHLFTADQQAAITYPSQSFAATADGSAITLQVTPVTAHPDLRGIVPAGNVYLVTASTRLISPVVVTLRYGSQQSGPPSEIFGAESATSTWRSIGSINSGVPFTVAASTQALGYFVVGFPPSTSSTPPPGAGGGGPPLTVLIAVAAVVLVVLAGVPLLATRRRGAPSEPPEPATPPASGQNLGGARRRRRRGRRR